MSRSAERGPQAAPLPETGRHVYDLPEAVSVYEPSHHIPDSVKTAMALQVLEEARHTRGANGGSLRVLDAGIGGGRLLLLPLLDCAGKLPLEVIGIDNSGPMLQDLGRNLKARGYAPRPAARGWSDSYACPRTGSTVRVARADLEMLDGSPAGLEGPFDVVLSVLTLHHLTNWRLALLPLLRRLKPGGVFAAFEWGADMRLRDGNFSHLALPRAPKDGARASTAADFWWRFYEARRKFHPWLPEISASDYGALRRALRAPFFTQLDSKPLDDWPEDPRIRWDTVIGWIRHRAYSNFHRGLAAEQARQLPVIAEGILDELGLDRRAATGEHLGCRLLLFRMNQEWGAEPEESLLQTVRDSSLLLKTIHEERVKSADRTTRFATMLVQHDVLTADSSLMAINKWNLQGNVWDHADKALVARIDPSAPAPQRRSSLESAAQALLVYHAILERYGFSATDFVFRTLEEKPVLVLRRARAMSVRRHRLKNGVTVLLEIHLPEGLLDAARMNRTLREARKAASEAMEALWQEMRPIKESVFDIWPWVLGRYRDLARHVSKSSLQACIRKGLRRRLIDALKGALTDTPELVRSAAAEDMERLEGFADILTFHLTLPSWEWMAYVPSEMLVQENEALHSRGFGGVILAERGAVSPSLERFREHRLELLRNSVNLRFRTEGSVQAATLSADNAIKLLEHELRSFFPEETLLHPTPFQLAHLSKILGLLRGPSSIGPASSLTYSIIESFMAAVEAIQRSSREARRPFEGAGLHIRLPSRRTQIEIAVVMPHAAEGPQNANAPTEDHPGTRHTCIPARIKEECWRALKQDQIHDLDTSGSRGWGCVMAYSEQEFIQHRQIEHLRLKDASCRAYDFVHRGLAGAMGGLMHNALNYSRVPSPWAEVVVEIAQPPGQSQVRLTVLNPMSPHIEANPDGSIEGSWDHGLGMAKRFFHSFGRDPKPVLGPLLKSETAGKALAEINLTLPPSMVFPSEARGAHRHGQKEADRR